MKRLLKLLAGTGYLPGILIVVCGMAVYSNSFDVPFTFDDNANIVNNPLIKDMRYFLEPTLREHIFANPNVLKIFNTRLVGYLSFALNYKLNGLDVAGYHFVNIAIHLITGLLVYRLVILTCKTPLFLNADYSSPLSRRSSRLVASFVALLFTVHPIETQAVTYIVQRFASLATMWYILALMLYAESRLATTKTRRITTYVAALLSALLAMKTKEISFTLPLVVVLYEGFFFLGKAKQRLAFTLPFILLLPVIPFSLAASQKILGTAGGFDALMQLPGEKLLTWKPYLYTQFRVVLTYVRLLFFPIGQNLDYDYPIYSSFTDPRVFSSFLIHCSMIMGSIYLYLQSRMPLTEHRQWLRMTSFGIFWFYVTLCVESSIVPIEDVIFEHRVYLPSIGFFLAAVSGLEALKCRLAHGKAITEKGIAVALSIVIILFSLTAYVRNNVWRNEITLWEDVVQKSPNKVRPHNNLGSLYHQHDRYADALREYQAVLQLKPDHIPTLYNIRVLCSDLRNSSQLEIPAICATIGR